MTDPKNVLKYLKDVSVFYNKYKPLVGRKDLSDETYEQIVEDIGNTANEKEKKRGEAFYDFRIKSIVSVFTYLFPEKKEIEAVPEKIFVGTINDCYVAYVQYAKNNNTDEYQKSLNQIKGTYSHCFSDELTDEFFNLGVR